MAGEEWDDKYEGVLWRWRKVPLSSEAPRPCPTCGGTGKWFVWDHIKKEMKVLQGCVNCGGTGTIDRPVTIEYYPERDDRL